MTHQMLQRFVICLALLAMAGGFLASQFGSTPPPAAAPPVIARTPGGYPAVSPAPQSQPQSDGQAESFDVSAQPQPVEIDPGEVEVLIEESPTE